MILIRSILNTLRLLAVLRPTTPVSYSPEWTEQDWQSFEHFAEHHRLVPLLAHHAQTGALPEFPHGVMHRFLRKLHSTRLRHAAARNALEELEKGLTDAGLLHVVLKGPPLSKEAYPEDGLRGYDDLDLLIDPRDVPAASRVLRTLGYALHPQSLPAWLVRQYHFHTQWFHPETRHCVELHWRPADTRVLPRTALVSDYVRALRDRPAAMAVYLAAHLAKHAFAYTRYARQGLDPLMALHPWSGMRWIWVLDFQGLCQARALSRDALADEADRWSVRPALEFAFYLIDQPPRTHRRSPSFSVRAAILARMERELDGSEHPGEPPWWLRVNSRLGFRPVRLLDIGTS